MPQIRSYLSSLPSLLVRTLRELWSNHSIQLVFFLSILPWIISSIARRAIAWTSLAEIGGLVLVYWLLTGTRDAGAYRVRQPVQESVGVIAFAALWMLYRLAQYSGLLVIPPAGPEFCSSVADTVIPKFIEMTIAPVLAFLLLRYSFSELGLGRPGWVWIGALAPILALTIWGLSHQSPIRLADRTACFYFGAGLPEEVLFRGLLIPRLVSLTRRAEWGILLSGFIFGVTHIPIDLHGSGLAAWPAALESAFTYQMSIGLALGYAYHRTRNIWPLTVIHALIDSAPTV